MDSTPGPSPYALGLWKGPRGCTNAGSFHIPGNQENARTAAMASSDGKYTATMTVVPPPLPGTLEDPAGDRQRDSMGEQIVSVLGETITSLCSTP
jgi:D-alanyl-D-alanine carboxypeptidase